MKLQPRIGQLIRYHRKQAGLSRIHLARLAGVGTTLLYEIEQGKTTIRLDSLELILEVLNMRLEITGPCVELYDAEGSHENC